jgi:3-oxoacyl-[acyl-carrier-protein] synthase I
MATSLAILSSGIVTSVGLSAPAACAAIRAGISNPSETRYMTAGGEWMVAHQVPFTELPSGRAKLVKMAAAAVREALQAAPPAADGSLPLLLCVPETERPGRLPGIDELLFEELQDELSWRFHPTLSAIVPHGRAAVALALARAHRLAAEQGQQQVLIAAVDSYIRWPTLVHYQAAERLLNPFNSNGFLPGEAAAAVLTGPSTGGGLECLGVGQGFEAAHIDSGQPLRAEGLTQAIQQALQEAGCSLDALDFRITDLSGEQFYFKEAALALARTLRVRKEEFDIWHPADCVGEVGSAIGGVMLAVALAACRKAYAPGPGILLHAGTDGGQRVAAVLRYRAET